MQLSFIKSFLTCLILFVSPLSCANDILNQLGPDEGILLIDVRLILVSDINHTESDEIATRNTEWYGPDSYTLTNLQTQKRYGGRVGLLEHRNGIQLIKMPEGFYCIDEVVFSRINVDTCGEPIIKVVKGKINNAGRWRFASAKDGAKLIGSLEKLDITYDLGRKEHPEYFEP